jgi:outer membrane lipoprotein SlyB
MNPRYMLFAPLVALTLGGCVTPKMEGDVTARELGVPEAVQFGVAYSVRPVRIEDAPSTSIGAGGGALLGGLAGSAIGHDTGSAAGAVAGAILGGVAGNAIERSATQKEGQEITVQLDGGGFVSVTQADAPFIVPGERVELLSSGGVDRVVPIPEAPNTPAGKTSPGH